MVQLHKKRECCNRSCTLVWEDKSHLTVLPQIISWYVCSTTFVLAALLVAYAPLRTAFVNYSCPCRINKYRFSRFVMTFSKCREEYGNIPWLWLTWGAVATCRALRWVIALRMTYVIGCQRVSEVLEDSKVSLYSLCITNFYLYSSHLTFVCYIFISFLYCLAEKWHRIFPPQWTSMRRRLMRVYTHVNCKSST